MLKTLSMVRIEKNLKMQLLILMILLTLKILSLAVILLMENNSNVSLNLSIIVLFQTHKVTLSKRKILPLPLQIYGTRTLPTPLQTTSSC